jgi:hypothetical protein
MCREWVNAAHRREPVRQYVERHSAQALVARTAQVARDAADPGAD